MQNHKAIILKIFLFIWQKIKPSLCLFSKWAVLTNSSADFWKWNNTERIYLHLNLGRDAYL